MVKSVASVMAGAVIELKCQSTTSGTEREKERRLGVITLAICAGTRISDNCGGSGSSSVADNGPLYYLATNISLQRGGILRQCQSNTALIYHC